MLHPLAAMVAGEQVPPQAHLKVNVAKDGTRLYFSISKPPLRILRPTA